MLRRLPRNELADRSPTLRKGEGSYIDHVRTEDALKVTSFKLRPEHLRALNEEAVRGRHIVRGRLSRSAALRHILTAWVEAGCPAPNLEDERPEDLETISFSVDNRIQEAIEEASVTWSSGERLVDKSLVVRAVIEAAAERHASNGSAS